MKIAVVAIIAVLMQVNCTPRPHAVLKSADAVDPYNFTAEEAASRSAEGTLSAHWASSDASSPQVYYLDLLNQRYPTANYKLTDYKFDYRADGGIMISQYSARATGPINTYTVPSIVEIATTTGRNTAKVYFKFDTNLRSAFTSPIWWYGVLMVVGPATIVAPVLAKPFAAMAAYRIFNYLGEQQLVKGSYLDAAASIEFEALRLSSEQSILKSLADTPSYIHTVIDRKIRQNQFRAALANLLMAPAGSFPFNISRTPGLDGPSFVSTLPVDINKLSSQGNDFLVINTPGEIYKMTVLSGLAVRISLVHTGSASAVGDWSFTNTLGRSQVLAPAADPCTTDCFASQEKQALWGSNNLGKFNIALAKINGLVAALPATDVNQALPGLRPMLQAMNTVMADLAHPANLQEAAGATIVDDQATIDTKAVAAEEADIVPMDLTHANDASSSEGVEPMDISTNGADAGDVADNDALGRDTASRGESVNVHGR